MPQKNDARNSRSASAEAPEAAVFHPDSRTASTAPEIPAELVRHLGKGVVDTEVPDLSAVSPAAGTEADRQAETQSQPEGIAPETADPNVDSPETNAAVDDIMNKESDQLLAGVGQPAAGILHATTPPRGFGGKLKRFFVRWWRNKKARWLTIAVFLAAVTSLAVIPSTRYAVLNLAGVRSTASVIVLDSTTQLPLRHVTVRLGDKKAETDRDGVARLKDLRLGNYRLTISRVAFAPQTLALTIGWGSNPLGAVKLQAVGTQYTLQIRDYVSDQPIEGAEADAGDFNALSDKTGKIVLTVGNVDITKLTFAINAAGYRSERFVLDATANTVTRNVILVPAQKTVFMSKDSGRLDLFSADLDGQNRKLLLAGTGHENSNGSLVISSDNTQAALVSTRDGLRNADGYLLYGLTFVNLQTGTSVTVDHAEQIQLVDWLGKRLVYRSTTSGESASNSGRNKLVSYSYDNNARTQLATANQFNVILSAGGAIYYAVSGSDSSAALGLFRVNPDGTARERLSTQEVWTGLRTAYNLLTLQQSDAWYTYALDTKQLAQAPAPGSFVSLEFSPGPSNQKTAWTEIRDGKGALLVKDTSNAAPEAVLASQPGMTTPVRWLDKTTLLYRVVSQSESAEYVVSTLGGQPHKVVGVTPVFGYTQVY